ncbi:MAG: hypothetical protein ACRDRJ_22535 [Streptosporangiaceae bacterium]
MNSPESARLARVERQVACLLQHLGIDPEVTAGEAGSPYPPELLVALQRGRMVEAIKIYRQVTGAGLREAKAACEALARGGLP